MTTSAPKSGEDFRGTRRFFILRRLGAGGAGVVYEAYDREQGARVALKVLKKLQPDALLRFKNEFRALQDIQHPNLVSLGELFEDDGTWFFTMEYVDGRDFVTHVSRGWRITPEGQTEDRTIADTIVDVAPAPVSGSSLARAAGDAGAAPSRPPYDEKRLRSALVQLVKGVRALHAAGKVHRDIKASNILVTEDGRLVLLDFGLIMEARRAREEAETHMVVGTEKYMAPEQAAAVMVGPGADCYSLGVVLYRSLTGKFPFGEASGENLLSRQRKQPPSPRELVPAAPEDLNALCMDLLKVSATLRPTCDQILERLSARSPITGESLPPSSPTLAGSGAPFVGRELQLAMLRDAFDETLRGATCTIALIGESGVGKSTLAARFAEMVADETGAVVLSSRCYERESVPYKAFDGIVDGLSRVLARTAAMDLAEMMPRRAALLAQAFPVLRRVVAFADAAPPSEVGMADPMERRSRLFGAIRELLRKMADRLPVVLVIDDLQWSDADSLALLRELLRPPDSPAVLVVVTARAAPDVSLDHVLEPLGAVRPMHLDRLEPGDALALARRLLERVPWGTDKLADRIAREAGGHPLFIDELVRHALQGGEERAQTAKLDEALAERVARLDPTQRAVIEAVAVAGGPIRLDVAAEATSSEIAALVRAVSRLRASNLVRASGVRRFDRVEAYHDRVRDAVVARVSDEARRTWHRKIATAIEACSPGETDALVTHWRGAQEPAKASRYALKAAVHASDALAFDRAARMYNLALSTGASSAEDVRAIRTNLAIALVNAGRGAEAAREFLEAAKGATSDVEILDLRRRAAEQLLFSGHLDEGLVVLSDVLAAMGMEVPRTNRSALASLLVRRGQLRLRGLDFKEREAHSIPEEELTRIDMLSAISGALGMVDTVRGADFQTRHALLALRAGEPLRIVRALSLEAAYSATGGTKSAPRTALIVTRSRELAARFPDQPIAHGWTTGGAAAAAFLEGRWKDAFDLFSETATVFRERVSGQAWTLDSAHFYQLGALMHLGELKELGRRIPQLLAEAASRGDRYAMTHFRTGVLSIAWLARGDATGARREADDAIQSWSTQGTHLPHFLDVLAQTQIDLYEEKPRAAHARVMERWSALQKAHLLRVQFIRIKMLELRGRSALAVASASPGKAADAHVREAARCADDIDAEGTRWGAPLAKMLRAGACILRSDVMEGARLLAAAETEFANERMALHVAVARQRCSELIGGEGGALLAAASSSWMQEQSIAEPARMTYTIAPYRRPRA